MYTYDSENRVKKLRTNAIGGYTMAIVPIAFLGMFDESLNDIPRDEELICYLYHALLDLRESTDNIRLLKSAKYKNAIMHMSNWAAEHLDEEKRAELLNHSTETANVVSNRQDSIGNDNSVDTSL